MNSRLKPHFIRIEWAKHRDFAKNGPKKIYTRLMIPAKALQDHFLNKEEIG